MDNELQKKVDLYLDAVDGPEDDRTCEDKYPWLAKEYIHFKPENEGMVYETLRNAAKYLEDNDG